MSQRSLMSEDNLRTFHFRCWIHHTFHILKGSHDFWSETLQAAHKTMREKQYPVVAPEKKKNTETDETDWSAGPVQTTPERRKHYTNTTKQTVTCHWPAEILADLRSASTAVHRAACSPECESLQLNKLCLCVHQCVLNQQAALCLGRWISPDLPSKSVCCSLLTLNYCILKWKKLYVFYGKSWTRSYLLSPGWLVVGAGRLVFVVVQLLLVLRRARRLLLLLLLQGHQVRPLLLQLPLQALGLPLLLDLLPLVLLRGKHTAEGRWGGKTAGDPFSSVQYSGGTKLSKINHCAPCVLFRLHLQT